MTPEQIEQMDPETHADGFTPFWGYVVLWEKYKDMAAHIIALEARVDAAEAMADSVQKEGAARGNYLGTPTDRGGHSGPKVQAKESWFAARCKMSDTLAAFRATGETP